MKIEILKPKSFPYLTFVLSYVKAGYPSPEGDPQEEKINLAEILIKQPNSTFLIRVCGNSTDDFQIWGIVTYIIHKTR